MIILGVDIGSKNCGLATVDTTNLTILNTETLVLTQSNIGDRLIDIEIGITAKVEEYDVSHINYETPFMRGQSNVANKLGFVCGIVHLVGAKMNVPVISFAPLTVKKQMTGSGKADKEAVMQSIREKFDLPNFQFNTDHESDAIAIAMCK